MVELTSDKPQWFEWTVDLERGEEPEVRFRNGAPAAKGLAFKLSKNVKGHPELEAIGKLGKGEIALAMLKAYRGPKLRIWEMHVKGPQLDQWPTPGHTVLYGKLASNQISRTNIPERLRIFAEAAFRRPLRPGELAPIEKLVTTKLDAGMKPADALQLGFQTILCSPAFLHLHEGTGKLDDYALASRLSYFFWSSMPDQTLIQLAAAGKLHEPAVLGTQVDRMLADPKSQRFVQNFIRLWLNLDHIGEMPVSTDFVSFFRDNIDAAMRAETEMFFRHILDKNLPPREFLAADYTFVNRELALHYGLPPMEGVQLRQASLPKVCAAACSLRPRFSPPRPTVWTPRPSCAAFTCRRESSATLRLHHRRMSPSLNLMPAERRTSVSNLPNIARTKPAPRVIARSIPSASHWKISTPSAAGARTIP